LSPWFLPKKSFNAIAWSESLYVCTHIHMSQKRKKVNGKLWYWFVNIPTYIHSMLSMKTPRYKDENPRKKRPTWIPRYIEQRTALIQEQILHTIFAFK
jgi:hypothetical protein